ncbi:MAG: substrate-binding domain-containing protein [Alphaproteobacteria bacterium]
MAPRGVSAGDLRVLSTIGVRTVVEDLAPAFERAWNCTVTRTYDTSVAMMRRFAEGESGDVTICTSGVIDELIAQGKVVGRTDMTRSFIGVAVKHGAPKPDISTTAAFKASLIAAKSIVRSRTGASGLYFAGLIERIGLAEALAGKILVRDGFVGTAVASGEAEIAVQQISELMQADGVDIVGPLPDELQSVTIFSAATFANAKNAELAKAYVADLASPAHAALIRRNGMEPCR